MSKKHNMIKFNIKFLTRARLTLQPRKNLLSDYLKAWIEVKYCSGFYQNYTAFPLSKLEVKHTLSGPYHYNFYIHYQIKANRCSRSQQDKNTPTRNIQNDEVLTCGLLSPLFSLVFLLKRALERGNGDPRPDFGPQGPSLGPLLLFDPV